MTWTQPKHPWPGRMPAELRALGSSEKVPSWPGTLPISASRCSGADGERTQDSPAARRDERESLPVIMKIFIVADAWGKLKNNTMKFSTLRGELKRNLATREA